MQFRYGWVAAAATIAAGALAGAQPAAASTVDFDGSTFTYAGTAAADEPSFFAVKNDSEALVGISLRDWATDEVTITANARTNGCKYSEEFDPSYTPGDTIFSREDVRCPVPAAITANLGDGDDSLSFNASVGDGLLAPLTADGGSGSDSLRAGPGNDTLHGGIGDDFVWGYEGNDRLHGDDGNDAIAGMEGNDTLEGGNGDDGLESLPIGSFADQLLGADSYSGGPGHDRLSFLWISAPLRLTFDGQANDGRDGEGDLLAADVEEVLGGSGNDTIIGDHRPLVLSGAEGDDSIAGGNAPDEIWGGSGDDVIAGEGGNDKLFGEQGSDVIDAGAGIDEVAADRHCDSGSLCLSGLDTIFTRDGQADVVLCGAYSDTLTADAIDNYTRDGGQHHCEKVDLGAPAGTGTGTGGTGPGGTGTGTGTGITGTAGTAADNVAVVAPRSLKIKSALKSGLRLKVECPVACTATGSATVDKKTAKKLGLGRSRTLGKAKLKTGTGKRTLKFTVSKKARKRLAKQKKVTVTLSVVTKDASGTSRFKGRVTLKR